MKNKIATVFKITEEQFRKCFRVVFNRVSLLAHKFLKKLCVKFFQNDFFTQNLCEIFKK